MRFAAIPNKGGIDICKIRIRQGLSVNSLAKKAGLSPAAVSKIERGVSRSIRPLSAQKLCNALGMPFDDLFTIEEMDQTQQIETADSGKLA